MESTPLQRCFRLVAALSATALLAAPSPAQDHPIESRTIHFNHLDSGWVRNTAASRDVIAAFHVISPGADWIRLNFGELALAGRRVRSAMPRRSRSPRCGTATTRS